MQTIIGTLLDVTERHGTWPSGDKFHEHIAHVFDDVHVTQVTLQGPTRDGRPGLDPALVKSHKGERVCLETYSKGGSSGRVYLTAVRVLGADDLADALGLASV